MTRRFPLGERPEGSRIDDLGATRISVSPGTGRFEDDDCPVPPRAPSGSAPLRDHGPMR